MKHYERRGREGFRYNGILVICCVVEFLIKRLKFDPPGGPRLGSHLKGMKSFICKMQSSSQLRPVALCLMTVLNCRDANK